jgi:hypothetical protein
MNGNSFLDQFSEEQIAALVNADRHAIVGIGIWGPEGPPKDTWRAALSRWLRRLSDYLDRDRTIGGAER